MATAPALAAPRRLTWQDVPETPADRFNALVASHRAKLDEADRLTDFAPVRIMAADLRCRIDAHEGWAEQSGLYDTGMIGPNGFGPAVDDALRQARFHAQWEGPGA